MEKLLQDYVAQRQPVSFFALSVQHMVTSVEELDPLETKKQRKHFFKKRLTHAY